MQATDEIRKLSTSGGMFTILSDYILEQGGYVCGAAFNESWEVEHIIINNKKDLEKLRGSKYIQSNKNNVFKEIKELLNNDKLVLFSGCPCEIAGLKKYLKKDYNNLILIDLICGSVQPSLLWKQYLKEKSENKQIKNVLFRDKTTYGWGLQLTINFTDGSQYRKPEWLDYFYKTYTEKIISRKCCLTCTFGGLSRTGDITIADFWNIDRYDNKLYAEKSKSLGTSLVLSNNEKGDKVINHLNNFRKNIELFNKIPLDFIKQTCNSHIFSKRNWAIEWNIEENKREAFYDAIKKGKTFEEAAKYALEDYADIGILNLGSWYNYGGILISYSVYNLVKKLGYLPKIISYIPPISNENIHFAKKFHKKYFSRTKFYKNKEDLINLNNYIDTFIVGSDQVFAYNADYAWKEELYKKFGLKNIYYLSFANLDKKIISFAASYGHSHYDGDYENILLTSYDLSRFDYVSIREDDGVRLCKEVFGIDADQIIEPVYLLEDEEWNNIIADKLNLEIIDASNNLTNEVEDFLYIIKNADFVFTDSFHGTCFSSIFKKQFISFHNSNRGSSRYEIFKKLGITHRIVSNFNEMKNKKDLFDKIDYTQMDMIVKSEKERSVLWLKNALASDKKKEITPEKRIIEYLINTNDKLTDQIKKLNNALISANTKTEELNNALAIANDKFNSQINNSNLIIEKLVNKIAWWIPIKKWREQFRNNILN